MQPTAFATQPLGSLPHSGFVDVSGGFTANSTKPNIQEALLAPLRIIYTRYDFFLDKFVSYEITMKCNAYSSKADFP